MRCNWCRCSYCLGLALVMATCPHDAAFCGFLRRLLQLALPLVFQNILGYGITLVGVISVGHLGTYELSAAILASSAMNITGFAFLVRLTTSAVLCQCFEHMPLIGG